jgi:hypothetical protein
MIATTTHIWLRWLLHMEMATTSMRGTFMEEYQLDDYLTAAQRSVVGELSRLIDPCQFGTVRRHLQSPRSEITQVVIVEPGYPLEQVGAVMVNGGIAQLAVILALGAINFGVDHMSRTSRYTRLLGKISDMTWCRVLYLPPAYVVQIDE